MGVVIKNGDDVPLLGLSSDVSIFAVVFVVLMVSLMVETVVPPWVILLQVVAAVLL